VWHASMHDCTAVLHVLLSTVDVLLLHLLYVQEQQVRAVHAADAAGAGVLQWSGGAGAGVRRAAGERARRAPAAPALVAMFARVC